MSAPVLMGPNDHHVVDPQRGTFGAGLGKEAEAVLLEQRAAKLRRLGVVESAPVEDTPDVKALKEKAKTLSAAERELEAARAAFEAEKAAFEAEKAAKAEKKGAK